MMILSPAVCMCEQCAWNEIEPRPWPWRSSSGASGMVRGAGRTSRSQLFEREAPGLAGKPVARRSGRPQALRPGAGVARSRRALNEARAGTMFLPCPAAAADRAERRYGGGFERH